MVITKEQLYSTSNTSFYIEILSSNISSDPYSVLIYNRGSSNSEDPWLSSQNHSYGGRDVVNNDEYHSMLYGESYDGWNYWKDNHLGANVFIRNSQVIPEPFSFSLILIGLAIFGYKIYKLS